MELAAVAITGGADMKAIALVQTQNSDINQLQQNIGQSVNPLIGNPVTSGNLVKGISLNVGNNLINHGLGYAITGYFIASSTGISVFADNIQNNPSPAQSFTLYSSVATTANIYCF